MYTAVGVSYATRTRKEPKDRSARYEGLLDGYTRKDTRSVQREALEDRSAVPVFAVVVVRIGPTTCPNRA